MVAAGRSATGPRQMCQSQQTGKSPEISANAANCAQICLQKTLRVGTRDWGYRGATLIIVDIIDDMLSHDRAKAIKANLMPNSANHFLTKGNP